MPIGPVLTTVGIAVARNLFGWLENSLQDQKISKYEWLQLGETTFRIVALSIAVAYGFNLDILSASSISAVGDYFAKKMGWL